MLNRAKELLGDISQKTQEALRQRKERAEARKALRAVGQSEHGHGRFFLLHVPAIATICAAVTEWYWAALFCIEATGRLAVDWMTSTGSDTQTAGAWHFALDIQSLAVLIGLIFATIPIVMLSMVWLPVQFAMRGAGRWRRGTVIFVGLLANILVIVSGTVVLNYNRQDQVREALVVEQTADANRAMLTANVEDLRGELDTLMNHRSTYVATAASVGAVAYERDYVAQARATSDPRLPLLERALGSARRADELRGQIAQARSAVAAAAPAAASQANVEDNVGRELNTFAQYVEVWRPPFVAFICTLIGIFGAWWVLALIQGMNPKDVLRSGWASNAERIEDLRDEPAIVPERDAKGKVKMKPPRRKFTEAETGEEIEQTLVPEHYRTIKRGKPVKVDIQPDIPPDETGVEYDGGKRTASAPEEKPKRAEDDGLVVQEEAKPVTTTQSDVVAPGAPENPEEVSPILEGQPEPPLVSEQEAAEALAELEATAIAPDSIPDQPGEADEPAEQNEGEDAGGVVAHNESPERQEPETDPAKLIAAE